MYFDNSIDWLQAMTLFDIKSVQDLHGGFGENARVGLGRVMKGTDAINKIRGNQNG